MHYVPSQVSQRVTSPCPHMQLQPTGTYASQPPTTLQHITREALMQIEYILCIYLDSMSLPHLILTMLVLRSTDLRPEIISHDTYAYTHFTGHRILYGVILTACTV